MADMLQTGVGWLQGQLSTSVSQTVVYARGAVAITPVATLGRKLLRLDDGAGQTRIELTDADFIIAAADLVLEGQATEPQRGDRIIATQDGTDFVYEVAPYGNEPPWRWMGPYRILMRIHTKLIGPVGES